MRQNTVSRFLIAALFAAASSCGGDVTLENVTILPAAKIAVTDSLVPLSDHDLPFGTVQQGTAADQTVTVTNTGTADLVIGAVASANPLAAPFSITADTCSGQTIVPAGSCSLTARFAPAAAGSFNDSFSVPSNAQNNSSLAITVSGIGSVSPVPNIAVTDAVAPAYDHLVPFGSVMQGTTSDQTVTVTNTGSATLTIGTAAGADPLASPFSIIADTCSGQAVAPSASCTLTLRFAPPAQGSFADGFNIPNDDPDTPSVTFSVSGTGAAPNIVVTDPVSPTTDHLVPFGSVTQGYTADKTVTVRNSGTAALTIGVIGGADPLAAPFSIIADTCTGQALAPGVSCSLTVRFAPSALGSFSDSFDIPSNDPDTPTVVVSVTGTGTPPVPNIEVTDTVSPTTDRQVPFGNVRLGSTPTQVVTVRNTGTADLVIGTVAGTNPLAAPFSIAANTCSGQTLVPAGLCSITVQFAPTLLRSFSDSFNIPSNDPDTATVTVSVSGTGKPAADLPETGQTACYDAAGNGIPCAGTGQDGDLRKGAAWPSPRFTSGAGAAAGCITDNLTGLMWPKAGDHYPLRTWENALLYVAGVNSGAGLCGFNDWRLPNKNELGSLVHYGEAIPASWLNTQGFTNVMQEFYWTSTTYTYGGATTWAWTVRMWNGALIPTVKGNTALAWLVRAGTNSAPASVLRTGQTTCYNGTGGLIACAGSGQDGDLQMGVVWPAARFTTNTDTTVTDKLTGLTWTPLANTPTVTGSPVCGGGAQLWQSALDYITCLNSNSFLGYNDWRLPNVNELRSLGNDGAADPAAWLQAQGFSGVQIHYWSSDSYMGSPSNAWEVDAAGDILPVLKFSSYYVWPVRGGQ